MNTSNQWRTGKRSIEVIVAYITTTVTNWILQRNNKAFYLYILNGMRFTASIPPPLYACRHVEYAQ